MLREFIKAYPRRVFLDKGCKARLPVDLPDPRIAHYFLIAVTRGSCEVAKHYWGGGSSGSLVLNTNIVGDAHYETPFRVGFPLQDRRFVHVLDEMTLDILLEELDTIPDLIAYLECKERYFSQAEVYVSAAGEEQLLARYMCTIKDGKHSLPSVPDGTSAVMLLKGDWEFYSNSPQRLEKKKADDPSYMWDCLIEYQSSFIRAGTAITLFEWTATTSDHERVVRALADECRLSRRQLAAHFRHALLQCEPGKKFARVVISPDRRNRAYVFLTAPKPPDATYEEYRDMRSTALLTYCHGVKLKFPSVVEVVGIASEPLTELASSQDFLYFDLSTASIEGAEATKWHEAMAELDILRSPTKFTVSGMANEFPMPFNFSKRPEFLSAEDGMPMNRKARRAMSKRARKRR